MSLSPVSGHTGAIRRPFFALSLLLPLLAHAAPAPLWLQMDAGFGQQHLDEYDDRGQRLVHEHGPAVSLEFTAGYRVTGLDQLTLNVDLYDGDLVYDGQTQTGTPLRSESRHQGSALALAYEHDFSALTLGLQASRHWRHRAIAATPITRSLDERFRYTQYEIALSKPWVSANGHLRLTPALAAGRAIDGRNTVNFHGLYDMAQVALPTGNYWAIRLPLTFRWAGQDWSLALQHEETHFDRSKRHPLYQQGAQVSEVWQPEFRLRNTAIILGITFYPNLPLR